MSKKTNYPLFFAGNSALVVTFLLLVNRHWDLNASVNESVLEAWGTIMGAIFTAYTVYLLFKQNQQQLEDRKAASKPDIYPAEANVMTNDEIETELEFGKERTTKNKIFFKQYKEDSEDRFEMYLPILLHNIGMGTAKSIKYKWDFNKTEVFNFVGGAYDLPNPSNGTNEIITGTNIDFIPANNFVKIHVPYYFCTCLGAAINPNGDDGFHKKQPKLVLYLEYLDIHDNNYSKKFNVTYSRLFLFVDIKFNEIKI